uniref:Orf138 n=1 Tax=Protohalopteris sp. TaxID=2843287 RepID=A0A8F0K0Y4_9PHAE|nr:orf138 [Protohalopteris sp.]
MPKLKKCYFRNKFNHLKTYPYFISIDASNLTSTNINKITTQIGATKCHSALSCTEPPKLTGGCLIIRVFPIKIKHLEPCLNDLLTDKIMILGLYNNGRWYPTQLIQKSKKYKNKYKTLSLLINKNNNSWLTQELKKFN